MMLSLRPATLEDARRLYEWRDDPETQAASRNAESFPWANHFLWLTASLANPRRRLLIAECGGESVGTVRWDHVRDGCWELSWTVAPAWRGRGIGTAMVAHALTQSPGTSVVADVKSENVASRKIAEAVGFVLVTETDGMRHYTITTPHPHPLSTRLRRPALP